MLTIPAFGALLHSLQKGTNRKSKKPPPFAKKGMAVIARLEVIGTNLLCIERWNWHIWQRAWLMGITGSRTILKWVDSRSATRLVIIAHWRPAADCQIGPDNRHRQGDEADHGGIGSRRCGCGICERCCGTGGLRGQAKAVYLHCIVS